MEAFCGSEGPATGPGPIVPRPGGFTLVEVMTAVAIFGFAVLGLLGAIEGTVGAASNLHRDAWIREQLASRLAALEARRPKELESESEPDERGVRYIEQVSREEVEDSNRKLLRGFWRVRVVAVWVEDGAEQQWEASMLTYDP